MRNAKRPFKTPSISAPMNASMLPALEQKDDDLILGA
jgi:hypothetical protein